TRFSRFAACGFASTTLLAGQSPLCFAGGAMSLVRQPALLGPPRRPRFLAGLRHDRRLQHPLAQLLKAVLAIAILVAVALRRDGPPGVRGDAPMLLGAEPRLDVVGEAGTVGDIPAEDRLGRHLVDVLPPWPAGAHEAPVELFFGNPDCLTDLQHRSSLGGTKLPAQRQRTL